MSVAPTGGGLAPETVYHGDGHWRISPTRRNSRSSVEFEIAAPATEPRNWLETGGAKVQNIVASASRGPQESTMSKAATKIATKTETRVQRPRLHKVILFNDDYTPRDFVVGVLKAVFRLNETQALSVMITAHKKGVCVVAVLAQDIAETKAARATEAGAAKGYPLRFGTEPEE
jgi:ATP-dependent Clp protease adaptor protein ClpS